MGNVLVLVARLTDLKDGFEILKRTSHQLIPTADHESHSSSLVLGFNLDEIDVFTPWVGFFVNI